MPAVRRLAIARLLVRSVAAIPLFLWAVAFILIPGVIVLVYSFWKYQDFSMIPQWNVGNYLALVTDTVYVRVMARTLWIAILTTVITIVAAYPMAYFLVRFTSVWRQALLAALVIPFWTSSLIRNYAWIALLGERGAINWFLGSVGLVGKPLHILYTPGAVVLAAVYLFFPFAVLAIYSSLEKLGTDIEEAALDLGATPAQSFRRVTLPLSLAGLQAAVIFVFVPSLGLFLTPQLLGGARSTMLGNLQVTIFQGLDFGLGSAVSVPVLVLVFVVLAVLGRSLDLERLYGGGTGQLAVRAASRRRLGGTILGVYSGLAYVFLFAPMIVLALLSFDRASAGSFPIPGLSLRWYRELAHDPFMLTALRNSVTIAVISAVLSVLLAAPAAYAVVRQRIPGRQVLRQLMIVPMVIPPLLLGLGILELFSSLGVSPSVSTIVAGHVTYVVPYVFTVVAAQQYGFDRRLEEAAADLGAAPWLVVRRVLLPLMLPGIVAGVAFAFTLSLDEFIITFLLAGSTQTLPLYIYTQLRTEVSPTVNAIGTLIVGAAMASILAVQLVQGLSRLRGVAARGWTTPLVPPRAQKVPREV
jgi:ABC-type spermidine/putrescine transport system permease subunit I